jgi:hypothetical protein
LGLLWPPEAQAVVWVITASTRRPDHPALEVIICRRKARRQPSQKQNSLSGQQYAIIFRNIYLIYEIILRIIYLKYAVIFRIIEI